MYIREMSDSLRKRHYSDPRISDHGGDIKKEWYVFFLFKHEGKVYKIKKREGVNRIKKLEERLEAISELQLELKLELKYGWNPITDAKRTTNYLKTHLENKPFIQRKTLSRKLPTKEELRAKFWSKGL